MYFIRRVERNHFPKACVPTFTSKALWQLVKPLAREIQSEDAVLIIDDSIEEKPYTDESELICWHWDHCLNRAVKGINLLSALYHSQDVSVPIAFELIKKSEWETDKKTGKQKRVCPVSKHTYFQQMVDTALANRLISLPTPGSPRRRT